MDWPPKQLLQHLMKKHANDVDEIDASLKKYKKIIDTLIKIDNDEVKEKERHAREMGILRESRKIFYKRCDHPVYEYHPDPSGNNDSHYQCLICGTTIPRPSAGI